MTTNITVPATSAASTVAVATSGRHAAVSTATSTQTIVTAVVSIEPQF